VERAKAEAALKLSEEKYPTLFDSIDEGFNTLELMIDKAGSPVDFRILETNRVWSQHTGLGDVRGSTLPSIAPNFEWFDQLVSGVHSGESVRIEYYTESVRRWYSAYFSRVAGAGSRQVACVFHDISQRKRRESNLALLDQVGKDLFNLSAPDEILQTVGRSVGEFLRVSGCWYADIDEDQDKVTAYRAGTTEDASILVQTFELKDFVTPEVIRACRAGETFVVHDTRLDERTDTDSYDLINIKALVTVPFLWRGSWSAHLTVYSAEPRQWHADEIELLQEASSRLFSRLERARAEEVLRQSEEQIRLALQSGKMLSWEIDLATGDSKVSDNFADVTGIPMEERESASMASIQKYFVPEDAAKVGAALEQTIKGEGDLHEEYRIQMPGKELSWFEVHARLIKGIV
jgi:PAS domain-containing protein